MSSLARDWHDGQGEGTRERGGQSAHGRQEAQGKRQSQLAGKAKDALERGVDKVKETVKGR